RDRLPRRAAVRHVAAARAGRGRGVRGRAGGAGAARGGLSRDAPRRASRGPARAGEGGRARPADGRRRREHLRRRGAVARSHPPAAAGGGARAGGGSRAPSRDQAGAPGGDPPAGLDAPRLPPPRRGERQRAARVQGVRAGRRAVRPLRHADRQDPGRGKGHVVLPLVPALRGEQLGQPALAVEAPELGVAADRPLVDEDLRHRPAARQLVQPRAEAWVVAEVDLLVVEAAGVEERLRADAVAAPAGRIHPNSGHYRLERRNAAAGSGPLWTPRLASATSFGAGLCARIAGNARAGAGSDRLWIVRDALVTSFGDGTWRPGTAPEAALDWRRGRAHAQDGGDRAAVAALLGGRPDPPPLHGAPRPHRGDR